MAAVSCITSGKLLPRIALVYMLYLPRQLGALPVHLTSGRQYPVSLPESWYLESHLFIYFILTKAARNIATLFTIRSAVSSITSGKLEPRITLVYMLYLPRQLGALPLYSPSGWQYQVSLPESLGTQNHIGLYAMLTKAARSIAAPFTIRVAVPSITSRKHWDTESHWFIRHTY